MSKSLNLALGIGIAIVLFLVVVLGFETFYPSPDRGEICELDYNDFYNADSEEECLSIGGEWNPDDGNLNSPKAVGRCDGSEIIEECSDKIKEIRNSRSGVLFLVANLIAIIFIVVGMFIRDMPNISGGIAFSGIALFIYGFTRGWEGTQDLWKFITGVFIAILLIFFAIFANKKTLKKSK
jgi:hypothetical protein